MSKVREPAGPLPKSVYVRRRILLLTLLIAIPVVIVLFIVRPGSSGGVAESKPVTLPEDLSVDGADPESSAADLPGCKKSDIDVTAVASKPAYAPGENPELWMTISNTGAEACVIDLGTQEMVFEVKSGDELYWLSSHCQVDADSREVILEPDNPLSTEPIIWDRTRSSPETCEGERPVVPAGGAAYNLRVTANSVASSNEFQFLLND